MKGGERMVKFDETLTMLKELTDAKGIPGNEREPREVMKKYIAPYADEMTDDNLGSLIAKKVGDENGPKIVVTGHLDEVGFMISQIDNKGFLKFQTVGGWWNQVMLAQRVTIVTTKRQILPESLVQNRHIYYRLKHEKNLMKSRICLLISVHPEGRGRGMGSTYQVTWLFLILSLP